MNCDRAPQSDLTSPSAIKALMERHGFRFSKSFGQNFLIDRNIVDRIVARADIQPSDLVVEIGPGFGVLTRELCARAGQVLAIEIDRRIPDVLRETVPCDNLDILVQDVLKVPLQQEIDERLGRMAQSLHEVRSAGTEAMHGCDAAAEASSPAGKVKVVANLPYYITTPILMMLLEDAPGVSEIVIMMQREVADRVIAEPGSKDYGVLSLAVQYHAEVEQVVRVARGSFMPSPQVDSSVLRLVRKEMQAFDDTKWLFSVIRAAFGQRRKTLENALSSGLHLDKESVKNGIIRLGLSPQMRGEQLTLTDFMSIAHELRRNHAKAEL